MAAGGDSMWCQEVEQQRALLKGAPFADNSDFFAYSRILLGLSLLWGAEQVVHSLLAQDSKKDHSWSSGESLTKTEKGQGTNMHRST